MTNEEFQQISNMLEVLKKELLGIIDMRGAELINILKGEKSEEEVESQIDNQRDLQDEIDAEHREAMEETE